MSAKVTLGEYEHSGCSVRLKLVKSSGHNCEPTPFSDSKHDSLEMLCSRNPYTINMSN